MLSHIGTANLISRILNRGLNNHIQKLVVSTNDGSCNHLSINFDDYNIRFPNLLEIKCWYITPKVCFMLSIYSPSLQALSVLCSTWRITDKSIESVFAGCTKLKYIRISAHPTAIAVYFNEAKPVQAIAKYCNSLEVLKLNSWDRVESDEIASLSELTNLAVLDIDSIDA